MTTLCSTCVYKDTDRKHNPCAKCEGHSQFQAGFAWDVESQNWIKIGTAPRHAASVQVGGEHYKHFAIQPAEYAEKNKLSFLEGNIIKYVSRHRHKNKLQDLEKAKHCIDLLIQLEYKDAK